MKFLLKFKSWQIFILQTFLPIMFMIIAVLDNRMLEPIVQIICLILIYLLVIFMQYGWFLTLGISLMTITSIDDKNKINRYLFLTSYSMSILLINIIIPLIYFFELVDDPIILKILDVIPLIFTLYSFSLISGALRTVEIGNDSYKSNIWLDLVLLILFPIGVWFIQPRVNKIFQNN